MYRPHGFQDEDQLLETLVKDDNMTFFPEFNLLAATSSSEPFHESMSRETAIFNVTASEISSGKFFEGFEYVSELVFDDGRDKAFAVIDSFDWEQTDPSSTTVECICCHTCSPGARPLMPTASPTWFMQPRIIRST